MTTSSLEKALSPHFSFENKTLYFAQEIPIADSPFNNFEPPYQNLSNHCLNMTQSGLFFFALDLFFVSLQ